jgi:hypothetical protein
MAKLEGLYLALAAILAACSSPKRNDMTDREDPVACTLTPGELSTRREQLLPGLIERAEEVTDLESGPAC